MIHNGVYAIFIKGMNVMTYGMLKNIIIGSLFVAFGSVVYVLYDNQKNTWEHLVLVKEELNEKSKNVTERVIERIEQKRSWGDIQKDLNNAVVHIITHKAEINILEPYRTPHQSTSLGSGFLISEDGEIITNHHVIDQHFAVCIKIPALGKTIVDVDVVGTCPDRDLALLRIKPEGLALIKEALGKVPVLPLGDSDLVHRADEVMALGYPLGQVALKSTTGVVSGREHMGGRYLIQISAPINPGSSGGPTLNFAGEVIGIANSGVVGAQNVGYVIPSNELKIVRDDLRKGGLLRRPFLGIVHNHSSVELVKHLGNPLPGGSYVVDVYQGSPLAKAGVKSGDMIYEINGHAVDMYGDIRVAWSEDKVAVADYVSRLELGQKIKMVVYRHGKRIDLSLVFAMSELLPVHQIYPGYDKIDYEVFGGMVFQSLTINHIPLLVSFAQGLLKYVEFENEKKPALLVTHIIPNSQADRLEMLRPGLVVKEINGKEVGTLKDLREVIKAGVDKEVMTFKSSDGGLFALSIDKVLKDEPFLSVTHGYLLSPLIKDLLKHKNISV